MFRITHIANSYALLQLPYTPRHEIGKRTSNEVDKPIMTPNFYNPERVGELYRPDTSAAIDEGQAAGLRPAANDEKKRLLLLVDAQVDFVHTDGSLSVPGAVDDTRRTIDWLFKHLEDVTAIAASLDSHIPNQIFYPTWWVNAEGKHPDPYTPISSDDVQSGNWKPVFEKDWSREYVERLEEKAKKTLMIWPYHTMLGTSGHNMTPALYEAVVYHSAARNTQPEFIIKGLIAKSEFYSLLEPEVKVPDHPQGELNNEFLDTVASYDSVYIAGQAKSHCVLESVTSMMRYYGDHQPEVIPRLHVLMDCVSAVAHPEIDFDAMADETFERFARQGLKLVNSGDALD